MESHAEKLIRFVSWNTNGLKSKLKEVLKELDRIKADVAFIQETHIGPTCWLEFERSGWESIMTVYKSEEKGVAILVRRETAKEKNFKYICHDEDHSGRYIVLFCHLYGELFTLVNVYKHKDDKNVLDDLKDYLMETAEGVLVVGGDFNTVLHPFFDRESSGEILKHTTGRENLEDFIDSLNLRDAWSYIHPTKKEYTWNVNKSSSRIDMFLIPEEIIGQVDTFDIQKGINAKGKNISDHQPLVLTLNVQQQTEPTYPRVASMLDEPCKKSSSRNIRKINGAEILRAIKALTDTEELDVSLYKKHRCGLSEHLKLIYNNDLNENAILKNTYISKRITNLQTQTEINNLLDVRYISLILSKILAKRLSVHFISSLRGQVNTFPEHCATVTIDRGEIKISWPFLQDLILIDHAPPIPNCDILNHLFPKYKSLQNLKDFTYLRKGCALTNIILKLVLNRLNAILTTDMKCSTTVCFHRQTLLIHKCQSKEELKSRIDTFTEESGVKFNCNEP